MKIAIDIPDKYTNRLIWILAGRELVAEKRPENNYWLVKETSCNLCGKCCMENPPSPYGVDKEGKCNNLVQFGDTWECSAGFNVPLNCCQDPVSVDYCSIKHRKVK